MLFSSCCTLGRRGVLGFSSSTSLWSYMNRVVRSDCSVLLSYRNGWQTSGSGSCCRSYSKKSQKRNSGNKVVQEKQIVLDRSDDVGVEVENYKSDDSNYKSHVPVLVKQCCVLLEGKSLDKSKHGKNTSVRGNSKQLFIDATFGAGGYTREILRTYPNCKVIGIDTDYYNNPTIKENEKLIHEEFGKDRLEVHCVNFRDINKVVKEKIVPQLKSETSNVIDGIVFDLGVSSMQLDQGHRGFSFLRDGPLDMRMNPLDDECPTARDVVNNMSELDLRIMITKFGEDDKAYRIAKAIVDYRNNVKPFETTLDLANLIEKITPFHERKKKRIHPATKTFQAIRIFVNDELSALQNALYASKDILKIGTGRLVVVSYHSLEDRITKDFMKDNQDSFKKITKGTIIPDDTEVEFNVRSRSAKLRCAQRVDIISEE